MTLLLKLSSLIAFISQRLNASRPWTKRQRQATPVKMDWEEGPAGAIPPAIRRS
jgi:hypothetical protein